MNVVSMISDHPQKHAPLISLVVKPHMSVGKQNHVIVAGHIFASHFCLARTLQISRHISIIGQAIVRNILFVIIVKFQLLPNRNLGTLICSQRRPQVLVKHNAYAKRGNQPKSTHNCGRKQLFPCMVQPVHDARLVLPVVQIQPQQVRRRGHGLGHGGHHELSHRRLGVRALGHAVRDERRDVRRQADGAEYRDNVAHEECCTH